MFSLCALLCLFLVLQSAVGGAGRRVRGGAGRRVRGGDGKRVRGGAGI